MKSTCFMDLKLTIDSSIIAISLNRYILLMFTSNRSLTDCLPVKPADKTILKIHNLIADTRTRARGFALNLSKSRVARPVNIAVLRAV